MTYTGSPLDMPKLSKTLAGCAIGGMLCAYPLCADRVDFQVFNDQQSYAGVLLQQGRVQLDADWTEPVVILQHQAFDVFSFQFDPDTVQPVVAPGHCDRIRPRRHTQWHTRR